MPIRQGRENKDIKWPCPYGWSKSCSVPIAILNSKTWKFKMPFDAKLPCWLCGLGSKTYSDFGPLSQHVRRDHPEIVGLMKEATFPQGGDEYMNVGQYNQGAAGNRLPLLDPKLFRKLQDRTGHVTGKMLACSEVKTPKFKGLVLNFKTGTTKYTFLANFDRWDISGICAQLKSEDTDDWIGESVRFVAKKGKKGGTFINVELPGRKKGKR